MKKSYDYIIAGAGLAGLSLAYRMLETSLAEKNVLIIDKSLAPNNDKTWSFWHQGAPPFRELTAQKWDRINVQFGDQMISEKLDAYGYYSIHSGLFKKRILNKLKNHKNFDLVEAPIGSMSGNDQKASLKADGHTYIADYIFQSCFKPGELIHDVPHYPLIQHFVGAEIETSRDVFDANTVTLMDFDLTFTGGVAFVYILPWSPRRVLVEYTIFSDQVKEISFYRNKLSLYLFNKFNLRALAYNIDRIEKGQIPMQDHIYVPYYAPRVLNMGSVGGLTKPSTGYTFSRIQSHIQNIIDQLTRNQPPALLPQSSFRYRAYDLWLLQIINEYPHTAIDIFRQIFTHNSMDDIFRFLGEETTLRQDLKVMSNVSYTPFLRAIWQTKKRLTQLR